MNIQDIVTTVQKELVDRDPDKRLKLNPEDPLNVKLEEFEDNPDTLLISGDVFDERKRKSYFKEKNLFQDLYTKYKKESLPVFLRRKNRIERDR